MIKKIIASNPSYQLEGQNIFIELREVLAELYPKLGDTEVVASDAGLDKKQITFDTRSQTNWHNILSETVKQNRLDTLLSVVPDSYKQYPKFKEVYNRYRYFVDQGGVITLSQLSTDDNKIPRNFDKFLVLILVILVIITGALVIPILTPTSTIPPKTPDTTTGTFFYGVTVKDHGTNQPIINAKVRIEVEGIAPLGEYTDSNGFARIFIPATLTERPGRLRVEADGYLIENHAIDLWPDKLPNELQLTRQ